MSLLRVPIELRESDVLTVASETDKEMLLVGASTYLGDVATPEGLKVLSELIPKAIAQRIAQMVPDGFAVAELHFEVEISGKVLGSGVSGVVKVVMGPAGEKA